MTTLLIQSGPSNSASALARSLGIRKLGTVGPRLTRPITLLNWGCGNRNYLERYGNRLPNNRPILIYNHPDHVSVATNKLRTLQLLSEHGDIPIPNFTTEREEVYESLTTDYTLQWMARQILSGHSGEGIVPLMGGTEYGPEGREWPDAPLYTKYIKKEKEYRVHVIFGPNGGVYTDTQQKRRRTDVAPEDTNYQIRNHHNGWVYCRNNITNDPRLVDLAVLVGRTMQLDFCAVDIIWNRHEDQYYVLEVNTAPGLEGQTLEFYTNNLRRLI